MNNINKYIILYLMILLWTVKVSANSSNINKISNNSAVSIIKADNKKNKKNYVIAPKILLLKKLSEHDSIASKKQLEQIKQNNYVLNNAEQYLVYLIQANIHKVQKQNDLVIKWIEKAIELEPFISDKQLDMPDFSMAHALLADMYQQQKNYKSAFDSKEKYIEKYFNHLTRQTELRVKRLNEKYQMAKKNENKKLLEQNSELKRAELKRIESQNNQENINIIIISIVGVLLFFILFRQLKIHHDLKIIAKTDSLTKLANRKSFFAQGNSYMARALKTKGQLCVLMLDIDHLQVINEAFSNEIGDKVICYVARLANETMRSRDVLARLGGEEFSAILPDANLDQAKAIAERIREKIQDNAKKELNDISKTLNVTVSIGLASMSDVNSSFDTLLNAADTAMYEAKADGFNRVNTKVFDD